MAHIYRILNVVTEQFYVGSAIKYKRRRWEHWDALKKGVHHCKKLQDAWDVYGPDAFEFELLEEIADEVALQIEDTHLLQHAGTDACYNTAHTTAHPPSMSAATREKIRETMLRLYADTSKRPRIGKLHTEETKERIRQAKLANPTRAWLGKKRSEETRAKISASQKGVAKAARKYTPEGLAKVREAMRKNAREQLPLGFAQVFDKFPETVQRRYDFSNAVYVGALVRIEGCACPEHGVFSQYAAQFRKGRGCPQCGAEQRAASKRRQMKKFWATQDGRKMFLNSR